MVTYILPTLAVLSASAAVAMLIGRFIEKNSAPAPDECEQMARIAEQTISREEQWIPELQRGIEKRALEISRLHQEQIDAQHCLSVLMHRKQKAEASQ